MPAVQPKNENILKAMQVAGSSKEGSQYLTDEIMLRAQDPRIGAKMNAQVAATQDFNKYNQFKLTSQNQAWNGQARVVSEYQSMHQNAGIDAAQRFLKEKGSVDAVLHFDINDQAQYLRGYTVAKKVLDPEIAKDVETQALLDETASAFFAEKGITCTDSTLYVADESEKDKIKKEKGQPLKADVEKARALLENDFPQYCQEKGINMSCKNQGTKAPTVEVKPEANAGGSTMSSH